MHDSELLRCSALDCLPRCHISLDITATKLWKKRKKECVFFLTQMKCVGLEAKRMKATGAPLLVAQKWLSSCKNYENGHTAVHNLWSLKSCISQQSSHAESLAESCERPLSCSGGRAPGNFPSSIVQCILSRDGDGFVGIAGLCVLRILPVQS